MSEESKRVLKVALAGNPNSGKTTLFNALTGARHKVGNYPGVTVEKREGTRVRGDRAYKFVDLPGIYSLTAYSVDEVVARDFLLDEKPDLIVDVLDSTNLERHLYLCLQFQELGIPVVGALNMTDEAGAKGIRIDEKALSTILGVPMAKTVGSRGEGMDGLLDTVDAVVDGRLASDRQIEYGAELEERIRPIQEAIAADEAFSRRFPARWLAVKLLEKDSNAYERLKAHVSAESIEEAAKSAVAWIEKHYGKDAEIVISEQRYGYIRGATVESVKIIKHPNFSFTEAVDKVIMNQFLALPIFIGVLWGVFQITFALGAYPQDWLDLFFSWLSGVAGTSIKDDGLRSLLVDGIIGGVGSVFSFVPLIVILFFLLSILEDVGYMSRAAFATDKLLHSFGLHGQSVLPMMLGFGCSVPAIMAARTLKSPRDRIVTVLVIPFMSCGAKLTVHVLLAAAFFPDNAANMVILIYAIGVVLALLSALLFKKTVLKGDPTPFVMELPPYRAPTPSGVLWHVWEKTTAYVKKMGTVIMAASILVWAITSFPTYKLDDATVAALKTEYAAANPGATEDKIGTYVDNVEAEKAMEQSYAGHIGKFIEPAFRPIGFDWKLSVATLTGFAAKEVIVSTLGVLYRVGSSAEEDEGSQSLQAALRNDPTWSPLLAFAMMIFTLVIPPCFAAMATIRGELGWKWLGFAVVFMLGLGWILSFLVLRVGTLVGLS